MNFWLSPSRLECCFYNVGILSHGRNPLLCFYVHLHVQITFGIQACKVAFADELHRILTTMAETLFPGEAFLPRAICVLRNRCRHVSLPSKDSIYKSLSSSPIPPPWANLPSDKSVSFLRIVTFADFPTENLVDGLQVFGFVFISSP